MSYIVMARKWRPQTFESVVGQAHVVQTLKNAIGANRISHAYLFTGPRGVGKTTTARLLAKAVNCLSPQEGGEPCNHCVRCEEIGGGGSTDVIEIDAASNGLVDDARDLREKVRYAPVSCRYKVIIIDEVHMMSNAAFNALLKTLEEPPAHTLFILATTEAHKVPATIVSRCQRFDFRRIPTKEIVGRLSTMAAAESISVEPEALEVVARGADGSLRDAQSLFDQVVSYSGQKVTAQDVVTVLGLVAAEVFSGLVDAVSQRDANRALEIVEQLVSGGADLRLFMKDWVEYWRRLVLARAAASPQDLPSLAGYRAEELVRQAKLFPLEELLQVAKVAAATDDQLRYTQHPRLLLELLLLQLCAADRVVSLETVWTQLQAMETRLASAEPPAAAANRFSPAPQAEPAAAAAEPEAEAPAGEPALVADALEDVPPATYPDRVRQAWPAVLLAVGNQNRRVQALLRDVTVANAEEGWVELDCASAYHATGLEQEEARRVVEAALAAELGRPTRLRVKSQAAAKAETEAPATKQDFEEIARREPLVQKTLEMFGGQIVDVVRKPPAGGTK
ncbi:MAG: DNA polymerase III subunit gamma/tau [candidate division FCPU426 bacterium]